MLPQSWGDHPRLRGEHDKNLPLEDKTSGSPPPTRGTQLLFEALINFTGITPAYAGNTSNLIIIYLIS